MSQTGPGTARAAVGAGAAPPPRPRGAGAAVLWSYVLTVGRFTTSAVVTFALAWFLDPRTFGVMALAMVWVTLAQTLALHGPAQAVIQRRQATDSHFDAAFWVTVAGAVALAGCYVAAAPLWARANGAPDMTLVCWALAPTIVVNGLAAVPEAVLRRDLQFKRLSVWVLLAGLVSGAAGISAAAAGYGVWSLVVAQLSLTAVSATAVWLLAPWRPRLRSISAALRDIRRFSVHSISECLSYFVSTRADALVLGMLLGPFAIGLYRFATRITDTINEVSVGGLGQVTLPHLSRFQLDPRAFAGALGRMLHAGGVLALPAFGTVAVSAPYLMASVGPQWTGATAALQVLCCAGVAGALGGILAPALQAAGRPGTSAALGWVKATVTVAAVAVVGLRFAGAGAATQAVAIAVTFGAIHVGFVAISTYVTFRVILRVPIGPAFAAVVPAALAAVAAVGAGLGARLLVGRLPAPAALAATGSVAAAAALAVLIMLDAEVAAVSRRLLCRILGAVRAAPARLAPPRGPARSRPSGVTPK